MAHRLPLWRRGRSRRVARVGLHGERPLEALAPEEERHLLTFEGHVTHLSERDFPLLEHLHVEGRTSAALLMKVGDPAAIAQELSRLAERGYQEVMYTPSGPDVDRELKAFARIGNTG